jgi:hypothetical protein
VPSRAATTWRLAIECAVPSANRARGVVRALLFDRQGAAYRPRAAAGQSTRRLR